MVTQQPQYWTGALNRWKVFPLSHSFSPVVSVMMAKEEWQMAVNSTHLAVLYIGIYGAAMWCCEPKQNIMDRPIIFGSSSFSSIHEWMYKAVIADIPICDKKLAICYEGFSEADGNQTLWDWEAHWYYEIKKWEWPMHHSLVPMKQFMHCWLNSPFASDKWLIGYGPTYV